MKNSLSKGPAGYRNISLFMKHPRLLFNLLIATAISGHAPLSSAQEKADARLELARQLNERLGEQVERTAQGETLRQSCEQPNTFPPESHVFLVRLDRGIEVVTESHREEGIFIQKDYFMHESKVYAHRVSQHVPYPDGKTKRIAESYFLFDKGTPFYRSGFTARVPVEDMSPDFSKIKTRTKETEIPLPAGLEGWGDKLTAHAFDIARTFRKGVGRYTFGDWDAWLIKGAPAEGSGDPPVRSQDWLPSPDTLVLPVRKSESPDGIFSIGWGYKKGPVNWAKLAEPESQPDIKSPPQFSSKVGVGPIKDGLEDDTNFILHHLSQKPLCELDLHYPGERQRFNHDELLAHWSPSSSCVVVIVTAKWESEYGQIAWIKDGKSEGSCDMLKPLEKVAKEAVLKSKHPAAKRLKGEDADSYCFTLQKIVVEDDGSFEASVSGEIPKDDDLASAYYVVQINGTFSPDIAGGEAVLKTTKTRVMPPTEQ